jgi:hypothetical protein
MGEFKDNCAWHKYELCSQSFSSFFFEGALEQIPHLTVQYINHWGGYGISHSEPAHRLLEM